MSLSLWIHLLLYPSQCFQRKYVTYTHGTGWRLGVHGALHGVQSWLFRCPFVLSWWNCSHGYASLSLSETIPGTPRLHIRARVTTPGLSRNAGFLSISFMLSVRGVRTLNVRVTLVSWLHLFSFRMYTCTKHCFWVCSCVRACRCVPACVWRVV